LILGSLKKAAGASLAAFLLRRVDGFPVHAVMVGRKIIRRENAGDNNRRVVGRAVHPIAWAAT